MKEGCKDLRLLFFVAVGVLVGVLYQVGTPMLDDYWFSMSSEGLDGFRARISWLAEMTSERRMTDNWRLANVFGPLFLVVFPRWVFSVLTGLIVFLILRFGCVICRVGAGSLRGWLWAAIFILVFPWYDSMVCVMFALNYVWSTAATLLAIWLFFRQPKSGATAWIGLAGVGFVAGWMHEGFSLPLICAMASVLVYDRLSGGRTDRRRIALLAGTVVGLCFIMSSPSIWNRGVESHSKILEMPWHEIVIQTGPSLALFAIYALTLMLALRRRRRIEEKDVFFGVATLCALAIELKFFGGARVGWPTELYAAIGSLCLWGEWPARKGKSVYVAEALIVIAVLVNLLAAIMLQRRLTAEAREITELYDASEDGTVYYDAITPSPDLTLHKTTVMQFHQRVPLASFRIYHNSSKELTLLPSALRDFRGEMNNHGGISIYKGYIIALPEAVPDYPGLVDIRTGDGRVVQSRYRAAGFRGSDGEEYVYIVPHVFLMNPGIEIAGAWFD